MSHRSPTRWVVAAFVLIGALVAMWLIVRGLGGGPDDPEEEGTAPTLAVVR